MILKLWAGRQSGGWPPECRGRVVQMIEPRVSRKIVAQISGGEQEAE